MGNVVVDFVARGERPDEYMMVLVEEGPWTGDVREHLLRVQDRLYDCVDVAVEGALAGKFPASIGKRVVIRLDCYGVPTAELEDFFERFSADALAHEDYRQALHGNPFVRDIGFEINFNLAFGLAANEA